MSAIDAGDDHYMGEFGHLSRDDRPVRARIGWSDGMINDAEKFKAYLAQAKAGKDARAGLGVHGEWDEAWAVAILGEGPDDPGYDPGKEAYDQYAELAKDHPWIHPYYFQNVSNGGEVAEDMALSSFLEVS